jgi:hypothetical protein
VLEHSKYVTPHPKNRVARQYIWELMRSCCKYAAVKIAKFTRADQNASVVHKYKIWNKYTKHWENGPSTVYKLMTEESAKSDELDSTLSGGLCGVVAASGCKGSCN